MFIPRTLNEVRRSGNAMLWRAVAVGAIVAVALFLVLSANITLGQENLEAGQIAERDIRAPRDATFDSASETQAQRDEAAEIVQPVTEAIEPAGDNQRDQLAAFDMLGRRVLRILGLRDAGTLDAAEVSARLASDVPEIRFAHRELVAGMEVPRWEFASAAARAALEATLAADVHEDELADVRASVREAVTTDLPDPERALAGDVAAELVEPNVVINTELTEAARDQARAEVAPVPVEIRQGETIVREGDPITVGDIEALVELGLTRPAVQAGTVVGNALIAAIVRGPAGRLPVALRARGLAPQPIGPALLPVSGRQRRWRSGSPPTARCGRSPCRRPPPSCSSASCCGTPRASPWPVRWRSSRA